MKLKNQRPGPKGDVEPVKKYIYIFYIIQVFYFYFFSQIRRTSILLYTNPSLCFYMAVMYLGNTVKHCKTGKGSFYSVILSYSANDCYFFCQFHSPRTGSIINPQGQISFTLPYPTSVSRKHKDFTVPSDSFWNSAKTVNRNITVKPSLDLSWKKINCTYRNTASLI
jgi:hypothetical protein